jgi:acyl-CoA synthetase (AMP-forming)/AMP-acid ligase II
VLLFVKNVGICTFLLNTDELQVDAVTGETRTYADIMSAALSVADFLYSRGIRNGDVVGICSENSLNFILPLIGTLFIGATCAPLNPNYTLRKHKQKYSVVAFYANLK